MRQHQPRHFSGPLRLGSSIRVGCDDKIALATDQLKPRAPARFSSVAGAEDEWVIVGNCWGTTALRRSELTEFQRGTRFFVAWGLGTSVLLILALVLFG